MSSHTSSCLPGAPPSLLSPCQVKLLATPYLLGRLLKSPREEERITLHDSFLRWNQVSRE